MESAWIRSEILELASEAEPEALSARSIQGRLGTSNGEPDLGRIQDTCVSLVIAGELDVIADGTERRFRAGGDT